MTRDSSDPIDAEIEAALDGVDLQGLSSNEETLPPASPGATRPTPRKRSKDLQTGTIVGVSGPDVFVELGPRMQGVISVSEFERTPEVGETYDFTLRGRDEDLWLLSRREAMELAAWDEVEPGSLVKAKVTGVNTGGLELKVGPMPAFMPASQVALQRVEDLGAFLNQSFLCQVLEVARERKRIVLSRRAVLEAEREESRASALETLSVGALVRGKVTRVEKFGAFVQISPGVEGLVHVSHLSRKRIEDPTEFVQLGQDVEAVVLDIKEGGKRIGLSMKVLEPDPWDEAVHKYREGTIVEGTVVRLMEFGAFVELEPGIDGLVHVSQFSRERVNRIQEVATIGQSFPVRVLSVDPHARRIALSKLDEHGALLGSEEASDAGAVREALRETQGESLGTNLGSLFRKALGESE